MEREDIAIPQGLRARQEIVHEKLSP